MYKTSKNKHLTIITIITFLIIIFSPSKIFPQSQSKQRVVVIDAGHGGKDPGAISNKVNEKDIVLKIALKLGSYISKNLKNVKVIYTRKTDKFIELHERSAIANRNNADLFISIHADAIANKSITGTTSFVMGLNKAEKNLEVAKRENAVILKETNYKNNYSGFDPNSPEYDIIFSLYQNVYLKQSIVLAEKVQEQFSKRAGRRSRGVKQAGLVVLWNCTMPGILVETGFITNAKERSFLNSDYGQSIIASAIFRAVRDYFKSTPKKQSSNIVRKSKPDTNKNKNNKKKKSEPKNPKSKNKTTDIIFKVQIASSPVKKSTKASNFKGLNNISRTFMNGRYKYYAGASKSYKEIIRIQAETRKKFPDAFVVAIKNNKQISVKKALAEIKSSN